MGLEQALLGEWILTYVFFVYGMMCYAIKHSKAKLPGFPVRAQEEDHVLLCYWMHDKGIINRKSLRCLGIKQNTIDEYFDIELCKYNELLPNKQDTNINSFRKIDKAITNRHRSK